MGLKQCKTAMTARLPENTRAQTLTGDSKSRLGFFSLTRKGWNNMPITKKVPVYRLVNNSVLQKFFAMHSKISQLMSEKISLELLFEIYVGILADMFVAQQVTILLFNPASNKLSAKAYKGILDSKAKKYSLAPGQGLSGKVFLSRETLYVQDREFYSNLRSPDEPDAVLYIPIAEGTMCHGVITINRSAGLGRFSQAEIRAASSMGIYLSLYMEKIQLEIKTTNSDLDAVRLLLNTIGARDEYTHFHSVRVALYSVLIAKQLNLPQLDVDLIRTSAMLHDIGKIGIPDHILLHPGALTKQQFSVIQKHPDIGVSILGPKGPFSYTVPVILFHHERYDGGGYPHGLKGHKIPKEARIIAVADSFEAMTSDRPYRKGFSLEKALSELEINAGSQFDPEVVQAFTRALLNNSRISHQLKVKEQVSNINFSSHN